MVDSLQIKERYEMDSKMNREFSNFSSFIICFPMFFYFYYFLRISKARAVSLQIFDMGDWREILAGPVGPTLPLWLNESQSRKSVKIPYFIGKMVGKPLGWYRVP